jgi:hypothetical protein
MTNSDGYTTVIEAIRAGMAVEGLRWSQIGKECGATDILADSDHENVVTVSPRKRVDKVVAGLRLAGYVVDVIPEQLGQIVLCVHD